VNARGRAKLMGVGQRIVQGAAHVGGVVVVTGADRIRDVLIPVYRALELEWDPGTVGSVADEVLGVTWEEAEGAIIAGFARRFDLEEGKVSPETQALARSLVPRHTLDA
jgi:hypothetical protein